MKSRMTARLTSYGLLLAFTVSVAADAAWAQTTAFTYQGRLEESGVPANGAYDFCFRLFNDFLAGEQIGETLCATGVEVVNGLFTIDLNFGQQYATPEDRYLEIEVCGSNCATTAGNAPLGSGFFTLQPRQRITSAPSAAHANSAFALDSPSGVHSNAVFVDSAGRVGIGTTAPTKKLHVVGPLIVDSVGDQAEALVLGIERDWVFRQQGSGAGTALKLQSVGGGGNKNFIIETTGSVGIGTTTPAAKLDVRGDIRLGPSGQFRAASGEENLRIIRGLVSEQGTVVRGSGFTAVRNGEGLYTITFNTPFAAPPVVCATIERTSSFTPRQVIQVNDATTSVVGVLGFFASDGSSLDMNFHFIAVGPR